MHLFLDVRQKVEKGRSGTDADQDRRESAEQLGGAVAVVLSQPGDRYVQPEILQHLVNDAHLPLPAVSNNEIGQLGPLLLQAAVTPEDDLAHRSVIVGALHGLDVEMAVVLARGFSVAEHHARGYRMGPLQIGVVEAFDVPRLAVEAQFLCRAFINRSVYRSGFLISRFLSCSAR